MSKRALRVAIVHDWLVGGGADAEQPEAESPEGKNENEEDERERQQNERRDREQRELCGSGDDHE